MNTAIKIFLLLTMGKTLTAQNHYSLTGIVAGQENSVSVDDALLLSAKSKKIVKYTTILDGEFHFESILEGNYILQISCLGFKAFEKVILLEKNTELSISLMESTTTLEEVELTATKKPIENKNGNIIINVENTIFSSESNPLDLLSKLPTVQISPNRESISIIGKGNPLIYIGKQKISFEELNSLPIDAIESIEIIKNPSVKYEAEGRSLILITRKKNLQDGFKATFSETASFKKHFNNFLSSNFNLKKDKLELKFNASYNQIRPWESNGSNFIILDENIESNFLAESAPIKMPQFIFGGGIYFQINANDYFSISTKLRAQRAPFPIDTKTYRKENSIENYILTHSDNKDRRLFSSTNINYSKSLNSWGNLFLGAQYVKYNQELTSQITDNYNDTSFILTQLSLQEFNIEALSLKVDFEKEFKNNIKLEMGSNIYKGKANSFAQIETINPSELIDSNYDYKEENFAVYSQLSGKTGKFDIVTGLRIENAIVKGGFDKSNTLLIDRNNTNIFPKGMISFKVDSLKNITLDYSRSIIRPNYTTTSAVTTYINPFLEFSRNINLKPSFTDEVSLSYQHKENSLSMRYYHTNNPVFYNFTYNDFTRRTTISPNNFKNESGINIELNFPVKYKFWNSTNVLSFNINTISDPNAIVAKGTPYLYYYTRHHFKIDNSSSISINGWGMTNRNEGIFNKNALFVLNATITKKLFQKLDLTLGFNDIFKTMIFKENYTMNDIKANSVFYTDAHEISCSIKYSFGNIKKSIYKNKDIDENINRVR